MAPYRRDVLDELTERLESCLSPDEHVTLLLQIADIYEARGALTAAVDRFAKAAELDPSSTVALEGMRRLYAQSERWPELLDVLEHLSELFVEPARRAGIHLEMAVVRAERLGDFDAAVEQYRQAVAWGGAGVPWRPVDPEANGAPAAYELVLPGGRTLRLERDRHWRLVAEPDMRATWSDPQRLYPMVVRAVDEGFAREAMPFAKQLHRLAEGMEIGALVLAETQRKAGLADLARQVLSQQRARSGPSALLLLNLSKVEGDLGNRDAELELLRETLRLDPNSEQAVAMLQAVYRGRFGLAAAERALAEIARLPGAWRPQMWLGRLAHERGDSAAARELFRHAVTASGFEPACVMMAVGSLAPADGIAALAAYDPQTGPAHTGFLLVELLMQTNEAARADAMLRAIETRAMLAISGPTDPALAQEISNHARALRGRLGLPHA